MGQPPLALWTHVGADELLDLHQCRAQCCRGYHVRSFGHGREGQAVVAALRRYIREGSLFRENAANAVGL